MNTPDDDILEHALNFGIGASSRKFNVSRGDVYKIVDKFSRETCTETECTCEIMFKKGISFAMCPDNMECDKGKNKRIKI